MKGQRRMKFREELAKGTYLVVKHFTKKKTSFCQFLCYKVSTVLVTSYIK